MTVNDLIKELQKVEDKSIPVGVFYTANRDGPDCFFEYKDFVIDVKESYDLDNKELNQYKIVKFVRFRGKYES